MTLQKKIVKDYHDNPGMVPDWASGDFDTIFIFKIAREGGKDSFTFTIDHENLNNLSD